MQAAGIEEVEAAKADGRWEQAYESAGNMTVPMDFFLFWPLGHPLKFKQIGQIFLVFV